MSFSSPVAAHTAGEHAARRSIRKRAVAVALASLAVAALAWWWMNPPDPSAEVRDRSRPLETLERVPAPELGRGFERWLMLAGRDTVTGLWRAPAPRATMRDGEGAPGWSVVILGGIGTDDHAAMLVPDSLPVGVLAVSWPWKGSRHMSPLAFVASTPALRAALLRTPGAMARGVAAVRRASPGSRVALLGASLGVPPAVAAAPVARPDALVLVDGAADLQRLLRSETGRALGGGLVADALAPAASALAARLLSSLEPSRYGDAARGIPTLLVDAQRDGRYPAACVSRLHAAFPHAAFATHPGAHLRPENGRQVSAIVEATWRWLRAVAPPSPAGGAR